MTGQRRICATTGCGRPQRARGLRRSCYRMLRYRTEPDFHERVNARRRAWLVRKRAERDAARAAQLAEADAIEREWAELAARFADGAK